MKLTLVAAATLIFGVPLLAQPNPGGPVQMRGPHRGGGFGGGSGGGGDFGGFSQNQGNGFNSALPDNASIPTPAAPSVSMTVDGPFLFVLRGDTLMQFDKKTLKLLNSVELPRPTLPVNAPSSTPADTKTYTSPPLRPGAGFGGSPSQRGRQDGVDF